MAGISSIGVGSGLDLEGLVTNLVNAERIPTERRLAVREANIQGNISAFGNLKSALSKLQSSLAGLRSADALRARTATSSDTSLFSVSADQNAQPGSYSIQVLNLARAQRLVSADFGSSADTVGAGTLSISSGGTSFDVETDTGTTLLQLRDAINQAPANNAVTASLLTVDDGLGGGGTVTKLILNARSTGSANAIAITAADVDLDNDDNQGLSRFVFDSGATQNQLTELSSAADARIAVDGFTAVSSTNRFTGVIDGLTINALREPADPQAPETATLTISQNNAVLTSRVQEFVKAYNDARTTIRDLSSFNQATGAAGPLLGDATVRGIDGAIKRLLGEAFGESGNASTLASVGVELQRDGSLQINGSRLNNAINANPDSVIALFSADDGLAPRLASTLDNFLDSDGLLSNRTEGFDKQLRDIAKQRDALDLRVEGVERRLRAQFTALDLVVSRLQSSGDFLLQQLENTSKIITGSGK